MCKGEKAANGWQKARHHCVSNSAQTEGRPAARTSAGQRSVAERLPAEWNRRVRAGASSGHPSRYRKTKDLVNFVIHITITTQSHQCASGGQAGQRAGDIARPPFLAPLAKTQAYPWAAPYFARSQRSNRISAPKHPRK